MRLGREKGPTDDTQRLPDRLLLGCDFRYRRGAMGSQSAAGGIDVSVDPYLRAIRLCHSYASRAGGLYAAAALELSHCAADSFD
jgi:hypothetical protein